MKKKMLIIGAALAAVLVIAASVYFIFFRMKSEQVNNPEPFPDPTELPSPTVSPTASPLPEDAAQEVQLYPAYTKSGCVTKFGYIDRSGNFVIEPAYDHAEDFAEGMAIVIQDGIYKVIDSKGTVMYENDNQIRSFRNGMAAFLRSVEDNMLYGYINRKGQEVIPPSYLFADDFSEDGQAYVALPDGSSFQLIDRTGSVLENSQVTLGNGYVSDFQDGYLIYYDSDAMLYGVKRVDDTPVFDPIYSSIDYLGSNLFAIKDPSVESYKASFYPAAIFNAQGEQLTEYNLYDLQPFNGDYSSAADESAVFFIDKTGQEDSSLPSYDGGGSLTLLGDIVKAEIDGDLAYYNLDNTVLWKADTTFRLDSGILVKQLHFKPLRSVMVRYPKVEGLPDPAVQHQINEHLESIFTDARANITAEDYLSVDDRFQASLLDQLLVIQMNGYDYFAGAAHGMPLKEYYYIDIATGSFYELKDLFLKDSGYKTAINEIIQAELEEASEDNLYLPDSFTGITDAQYFYLTENSLVIYFYPYEIAPYAAGFPEFEISFDDLAEYLNTNGDFWKAFHNK